MEFIEIDGYMIDCKNGEITRIEYIPPKNIIGTLSVASTNNEYNPIFSYCVNCEEFMQYEEGGWRCKSCNNWIDEADAMSYVEQNAANATD